MSSLLDLENDEKAIVWEMAQTNSKLFLNSFFKAKKLQEKEELSNQKMSMTIYLQQVKNLEDKKRKKNHSIELN